MVIDADPMVDEFDTVASWTSAAVAELGEHYALPAACRGSGSPAALDWLAAAMGLSDGSRLLDSGAGVGGPSEYAARTLGVLPTLVEPMEGAGRAARDLFARPVVVADGARLPFSDACFDAVWSLGVLCTIDDKRSYLAELRRVVPAGASVGLLVYTRAVASLPDQPEGNDFPSRGELKEDLGAVGLTIVDELALADAGSVPEDWQEMADRVDAVVELRHHDDRRWQRAQAQQETITQLIEDELVVGVLLSCRAH